MLIKKSYSFYIDRYATWILLALAVWKFSYNIRSVEIYVSYKI